MGHSLEPLVCFSSGEWSPSMSTRLDLPNYRKACRRLRNMIPTKQGGAVRRPGTQFIGAGKPLGMTGTTSRLEKFQFAPGTTLMLEFCDLGVRFYSNGVPVQAPSPGAWSPLANYPNGAFATDAGNTYYLFNGPLIPAATAPSLDPTHWVKQSTYEVPLPYSGTNFTYPNYWDADVFVLKVKQINDVVYIVHPNFPVWKLTRFANDNWASEEVSFLIPPMLDQNPTDIWIAASATTGTGVTLDVNATAWAGGTQYYPNNAVNETSNLYVCLKPHISGTFADDLANGYWRKVFMFEAGHIGSFWQINHNRDASYIDYDLTMGAGTSSTMPLIGGWEIRTAGTWSADISLQVSYNGGVTWDVVTTLSSRSNANFDVTGKDIAGGTYRMVISNYTGVASTTPPRVVLQADNQLVYGLVLITGVNSIYQAVATVINPLYSVNATVYWSEGAWSDVRGYPQAVTVFQERMWYAASDYEPQRIWASQTDDLENFNRVDGSDPSYGMAFDLNAPGRGPIQWLNAQTDMFAGLAGAEWVITSGQSTAAITPGSILALEHSVNGSAPGLPGVIIGNACFYIQRKGTSFQQMLFSVFTNKYMSTDLQVLSQHLTAAGVKQFDFQQQFENQSVLWAVCGDGSLVSLTYAMDQEVFGWAKHTTGDGTDFGFLSVQVIYGQNGQDDEVWVTVQRTGLAYPTVERIWPEDWQTASFGLPDLKKAVYADCSITVTSPVSNVIAGLPDELNGRTGLVASITPSSGSGAWAVSGLTFDANTVTVPNYTPQPGDVVVVGLPINWYVQPMRLDIDVRQGPTSAIRKAISKLYLRVLNSMGGNWATEQGDVIPLKWIPITQDPNDPPPFTPTTPLEIEVDAGGLMQYADDPQFTIQGSDALPFTLLGVIVKYDIGGSS